MKRSLILLSVFASMNALATSPIVEESITLRTEPRAEAGSFCDIHTIMQIKYASKRVKLEERLHGTCRIAIQPNPRTYVLTKSSDDGCGSSIYQGVRKARDGASTITITDNSHRRCRDVVADEVVVEETFPRGQREVRYGGRGRQ